MTNNNIHMIIGQLNFTFGEIQGNTEKMIKARKKANNEYDKECA